MIRFPEWFPLKKHNENIDIPYWVQFYGRFYDEDIITVDVFGDNGCPGRMGYSNQVTVTTTYISKHWVKFDILFNSDWFVHVKEVIVTQ